MNWSQNEQYLFIGKLTFLFSFLSKSRYTLQITDKYLFKSKEPKFWLDIFWLKETGVNSETIYAYWYYTCMLRSTFSLKLKNRSIQEIQQQEQEKRMYIKNSSEKCNMIFIQISIVANTYWVNLLHNR